MVKLYLPRSGRYRKELSNRDKSLASYTSWFRSRGAPAATGPRDDSSPSRGAERRVKGRKAPSQRGIPGEINTASEGPSCEREEGEERRASVRCSSVGPRGRFLMPVFREAVERLAIVRIYECLMRKGHTSNTSTRTRMEVKNRRRRRDRLASTIGASRKGCSTQRIGHTQCNLTSCKKVPAYFFPQKAFPRPMLEVIDEGVAPASPLPISNAFLSARCNHARLRVSEDALHVHMRAHVFRGLKRDRGNLFRSHACELSPCTLPIV